MSITAGQPISPGDFINKSEANTTPSSNVGKVPKLEADGKISSFFTGSGTIVAPAGENLSTNDAVYINSLDVEEVFEPQDDGGTAVANWHTVPNTTYYAYVFVAPFSGTIEGMTIMLKSTTSGLYNSSQSYAWYNVDPTTHKPTTSGSSGSGSFAGVSGSSRYKCRNFSPTKTIVEGTEYCIVFYPSSTNANGAELVGASSSGFFSYKWTSTDSGSSWSTNGGSDVWIQFYGTFRTPGAVYKTDPRYHSSYRGFAGFVDAGVSSGADVTVNPLASKVKHGGFSGLTSGGQVWLDNTVAGGITQTTPSTWFPQVVGRATSTTEIMPKRGKLAMQLDHEDGELVRYDAWGHVRSTAIGSTAEVDVNRMPDVTMATSRYDFSASSLAITALPHWVFVPAGGSYHSEATNSLSADLVAFY